MYVHFVVTSKLHKPIFVHATKTNSQNIAWVALIISILHIIVECI